MPGQRSDPVVIRLLPPYPNLATLGWQSWVRLLVESGPVRPRLAPALERLPPTVATADLGDRFELSGSIDQLSGWLRTLGGGSGIGEFASALGALLGRLREPPSELRVGASHWHFGERTYLLGVVNVTPDSFSGDGVGADPGVAAELARSHAQAGADAIDLGGESTRPGHLPVSAREEIGRVVPALELIQERVSVPIWVDTSKAEVARAAIDSGADGINDVWGLRRDPEMAEVVARGGVPVICMHNRAGHDYSDLLGEILAELRRSLRIAAEAGIPEERVVLDPGIGFGKLPEQNYELLRRLVELRVLGRPLLVGTSRKSLIGWLLDDRPVQGRLLGTAATVAWAVANGADMVRVHDVAELRDVVRVIDELSRRSPS